MSKELAEKSKDFATEIALHNIKVHKIRTAVGAARVYFRSNMAVRSLLIKRLPVKTARALERKFKRSIKIIEDCDKLYAIAYPDSKLSNMGIIDELEVGLRELEESLLKKKSEGAL